MFSPLNNTRAFWGKDRDNGVPNSPVPTRNSSVRCRRSSCSSPWWWWNIAHLQGKLTDAFVLYSKLQVSRHTRAMYTMDYRVAIENCSSNYGRKICGKDSKCKEFTFENVHCFSISNPYSCHCSDVSSPGNPFFGSKKFENTTNSGGTAIWAAKEPFFFGLICHFSQVARANQLVGKHP